LSGLITVEEISKALPAEYTVSKLLDSGGQGAVFEGTCGGVRAAIKLITPHSTEPKRIDREVQFLRATQHESMVRVIGYTNCVLRGITIPVVAYEFIDGGNLSKWLDQQPPKGEELLVSLGRQISSAIDVIWNAKERVVHRDIKPHNIMERTESQFVLVDFGFAKHVDLSNMTAMGVNPGTPGFMSPEQAGGRINLTSKSDIFSLGVTMFMFATQKHPYKGIQPRGPVKIAEDIHQLRTDLSPEFRSILLSMLSISPSDRPNDLTARFDALRRR